VVAIDPLFRNARQSLRRYNLAVLGAREGIWRARTSQKVVALTFDDGRTRCRTARPRCSTP
jgi:peptidoglycan/xylan/chitin deacetylase (PgdA/CDA1 family)